MTENKESIPRHLDVLISDNMEHLEDLIGAKLYILREDVFHVLTIGIQRREAMLMIVGDTLDEVLCWLNSIGTGLSEAVGRDIKPFKVVRNYSAKR